MLIMNVIQEYQSGQNQRSDNGVSTGNSAALQKVLPPKQGPKSTQDQLFAEYQDISARILNYK